MTLAELKAEAKYRKIKQKAHLFKRLQAHEVDKVIHSVSARQTPKNSSKIPLQPEVTLLANTDNELSSDDDDQTTIINAQHQSTKKTIETDSDDSIQNVDQRSSQMKSQGHSSSRFTIKDVEDSLTNFNGDDLYSIDDWINEFTDMSTLLKWDDLQRLIYAKRMLKGSAKKFVSCEKGIQSWDVLQQRLRAEFRVEINSASIHARLAKRKRKTDESSRQYLYAMQEIAAQGRIEDAALIQHVIDGIMDAENNKIMLYEATTIEELKCKLKLYNRVEEKTSQKLVHINQSEQPRRLNKKTATTLAEVSSGRQRGKRGCFNCGSTDHNS